jgi:fibronectin-binding autotransporter adhesin
VRTAARAAARLAAALAFALTLSAAPRGAGASAYCSLTQTGGAVDCEIPPSVLHQYGPADPPLTPQIDLYVNRQASSAGTLSLAGLAPSQQPAQTLLSGGTLQADSGTELGTFLWLQPTPSSQAVLQALSDLVIGTGAAASGVILQGSPTGASVIDANGHAVTISGSIIQYSGAPPLTAAGGGTVTYAPPQGLNAPGASISVGPGTTFAFGPTVITAGTPWSISNSGTVAVQGGLPGGLVTVSSISGGGDISIAGGTLQLQASGSIAAGALSISGGALVMGQGSSLAASSLSITQGGILSMPADGSATVSVSGPASVSGGSSLTVNGAAPPFSAPVSVSTGSTLTVTGPPAATSLSTVPQGSYVALDAGALIVSGAFPTLPSETDAIQLGPGGGTVGGAAFPGPISGPGALTISGTAFLSGANTFSGGAAISGAAWIASDASLGAPQAPLTLDGGLLGIPSSMTVSRPVTITANGGAIAPGLLPDPSFSSWSSSPVTVTLAGSVSGPGGLSVYGNGIGLSTLSLPAANSYQGGTFAYAATLAVRSDSSLGAPGTPVELDTARLLLENQAPIQLSHPITIDADAATGGQSQIDTAGHSAILSASLGGNPDPSVGAGSLLVLGGGSLTLAGPAPQAGLAGLVLDGMTQLIVGDASHPGAVLQSDVTVLSGALRGHGTVMGRVLNPSGTVAPGGSIGVLTVSGSYVQGPAGTLGIEVSPPAASELVVTGNPGTASIAGTLALQFDPGRYAPATYTILSASGGISGTFGQVQTSGRQHIGLLQVGVSYGPSDVYLSLSLPGPALPDLPGAVYGSMLQADSDMLADVADMILDRGCGSGSGPWAQALAWGESVTASGGAPARSASGSGALAGYGEGRPGHCWGVAAGAWRASSGLQGGTSDYGSSVDSGTVSDVMGGVYGERQMGSLRFRGFTGAASSSASVSRPLSGASASWSSAAAVASARVSLPARAGSVAAEPYVGATAVVRASPGPVTEQVPAGGAEQITASDLGGTYVQAAAGVRLSSRDDRLSWSADVRYAAPLSGTQGATLSWTQAPQLGAWREGSASRGGALEVAAQATYRLSPSLAASLQAQSMWGSGGSAWGAALTLTWSPQP